MNPGKIRVLFVCMGNICRSPAAEGVFRAYVNQSGHQDFIHIESAGTHDYHPGDLPDHRMRKVASARGYPLRSRARQVRKSDFSGFDLVLAIDRTNLDELYLLAGRPLDHVRLFGSFIDDGNSPPCVPDPYYGGADGFEQVLDMIETACPALLQYCLEIGRLSR
jgi:protein-tyrosine phosphatase